MRNAGLPSANAASAWPVLSWQADQTKRPICSLMARAKPMRCAVPLPPSFRTPFLLPLSFRANFPLLLESRNGSRSAATASALGLRQMQMTDISYFFSWVGPGAEGRSGSLFSACLTRSNPPRPQSTRQRAAKDEPQNLKRRVSADGRSEVRVRRKSPACDSAGAR